MNDAERWMEIAETMTFEATIVAEIEAQTEEMETVEAEMIEAAPEPRARVLSITQLRQKLGIEEVAAPTRTRMQEPMAGGPPRIVSRRRDMAELMAG